MQSGPPWLAHSARNSRGIPAQEYGDHVSAVLQGTLQNLEQAAHYASKAQTLHKLQIAGAWSAIFHDLGKLEDSDQHVLRNSERDPLPYPHESAGALHCLQQGQRAAAWLIHSHHQGLTDYGAEISLEERGEQGDSCRPFLKEEEGLLSKIQQMMSELLRRHAEAIQTRALPTVSARLISETVLSTFSMRLLLSALVDADHGDTARNYRAEMELADPEPRWQERLEKLEEYVCDLGKNEGGDRNPGRRDPLRQAVYAACGNCPTDVPIYACDAPVGSGKTTAVMSYLLRAAIDHGLRRIFIVLPFTNIINQSVGVYRKALTLPDENPESIVAAHHHAAEFLSLDARALTTLWRSPIIVTTAVQFFETLAACATPRLRKLHALPGSAVFVDEAHAAMPLHLWPYMWDRLETLCSSWRCRFVLGSGSLPRLWENARLFAGKQNMKIPSMLPAHVTALGAAGEKERVEICIRPEVQNLDSLCAWVKKLTGARLVVMNTLQSAAALARELDKDGIHTLHLSTALTPADREEIIAEIRKLLDPEHRPEDGWVLVATSCIEAGVDVSFDVALRERSSVSSLIQIGGRVNRHGNESRAQVWDFCAADANFTPNASLDRSRKVVGLAFRDNRWETMNLSDLMTWAIEAEWKELGNDRKAQEPREKEFAWEFAAVAGLTRLIDDDASLAVVDRKLLDRLSRGEPVKPLELIRGSVSVRRKVLDELKLTPLPAKKELYAWPEGCYDAGFLGIMSYLLDLKNMAISKLAML